MRRRNKYVSTFWGGPKPPQKEVFQTIYFGALSCLKNFCRGAAKSHTVETKTNGKKYLSFLSHAAFHAEPVHLDVERELRGCSGSEQQAGFDEWRTAFSQERPHEALGMKCPAQVYEKSDRKYKGTPEDLEYKGMESR